MQRIICKRFFDVGLEFFFIESRTVIHNFLTLHRNTDTHTKIWRLTFTFTPAANSLRSGKRISKSEWKERERERGRDGWGTHISLVELLWWSGLWTLHQSIWCLSPMPPEAWKEGAAEAEGWGGQREGKHKFRVDCVRWNGQTTEPGNKSQRAAQGQSACAAMRVRRTREDRV